jgi:protein involved in polysaccharide export with SLBB domain
MTRTTLATLAGSVAWKIRLVGVLLASSAAIAGGQSSIGEMRRQATRAELERAAKMMESAAVSQQDSKTRAKLLADAQTVRQRLENGDFLPGDRILLLVADDTALTDTFTVRGDQVLPLPNIPPITLHGVLDSELEPHLTKELLKYIKTVSLKATPLVRISMLGFPKSDFYTIPVDLAITDLISQAGGWGSATAVSPNKAVIRRGGEVFLDTKATAEAVRLNKTVGDMALRDGDEFSVPDKASSTTRWQTGMAVLTGLASVFWLVRSVSR